MTVRFSVLSSVRFSVATGVTGVLSSVLGTSVRFSVAEVITGKRDLSVRFCCSITFLNSISVSSVDSGPLGYLTGVGRR